MAGRYTLPVLTGRVKNRDWPMMSVVSLNWLVYLARPLFRSFRRLLIC